MQDCHGETYVVLVLHKQKRVGRVQACIDKWNLAHTLMEDKIFLHPHPGHEPVMTFGKGTEALKSHYVYRMLLSERNKMRQDLPHTFVEHHFV
jgi:hypothetical protein